ncbi:hypothetical protein [Thermovibrio sp.]
MQYIRGKLTKPDDFLILIDILKEKLGEVRLQMPYQDGEISICFDGILFYLSGKDEGRGEKFSLIKFLEEWLTTNIQPVFEFFEGEKCSGGLALTEEELMEIVNSPTLWKVREIPEHFEITKIEVESVPSFLVAHWKTRKPLSRKELYKHGYTLSDVVKFLEAGLIQIRPFKMADSMPVKLRVFLTSIAAICLLYMILPLNFIQLNILKFGEALNWGLREKVLGAEGKRELPVKGCFRTKFYLLDDTIVNPGIDGVIGTKDDQTVKLPKKGYKPVFAIPVK